jgi:hypothetical protein
MATPSAQTKWMTDIGRAADELGYGIEKLEPRYIRLTPIRSDDRVTVEIESVFLSGDSLRRWLKPVERR